MKAGMVGSQSNGEDAQALFCDGISGMMSNVVLFKILGLPSYHDRIVCKSNNLTSERRVSRRRIFRSEAAHPQIPRENA